MHTARNKARKKTKPLPSDRPPWEHTALSDPVHFFVTRDCTKREAPSLTFNQYKNNNMIIIVIIIITYISFSCLTTSETHHFKRELISDLTPVSYRKEVFN